MQKQFIKGLVTKAAEGKYKVLASTSAIDRQGDSIDQQGWDLSNFKLNPVMPWAHDYSELPVAKVTNIEVTKLGLEAEFEFAPAEGNPKAQQIKVLYDEGYLNAVSVGFIPKDRKGNVILKAELLEISFVPVPANQEALRLTMKAIDDNPMLTDEYRAQLKTMFADFEKKGEIADELDAEEAFEKKWENWCKIQDIFSAFWNVYFAEETPVENFASLLQESIGLLQIIADGGELPSETAEAGDQGDGSADGEGEMRAVKTAISADTTVKFLEFVVAKAGRTLSKKTLEKIDAAIESMKGATSVLEELKTASSEEDQDGNGDTSSKDEKGIDIPALKSKLMQLSADDLKLYRQKFVADDKVNELSLSVVNALMREKGIKA
jgi:HK97 family phage prohead protease